MEYGVQVHSGKYFDLGSPDADVINIDDIAHSLSMLCRFNGHCREFYSVAQHSVLVSQMVPREFALWGLLHDAAEAYLGDVARPLKKLLADYRAVEGYLEGVVLETFGLYGPIPNEVKLADLRALATEKRDLMPEGEWVELRGIDPYPMVPLTGYPPRSAKALFRERYRDLTTL